MRARQSNKKTEKWETRSSSSASTYLDKLGGKVFYNLAISGNSEDIKDLHDYLSKQISGWRAPLEVYFIPFFYFYILIHSTMLQTNVLFSDYM